jgi:hypothetical protein
MREDIFSNWFNVFYEFKICFNESKHRTFSNEINVATRCLSMGHSPGKWPVWLWSYPLILWSSCHLLRSPFIIAEDAPFLFRAVTGRLSAEGIQCGMRFMTGCCELICHWWVQGAEATVELNPEMEIGRLWNGNSRQFSELFPICPENVPESHHHVPQIRFGPRYSHLSLLAQTDAIEMILLPKTASQKYFLPCQMHI